MTIKHYHTLYTDIEVDIQEILDSLDDKTLEYYGLQRRGKEQEDLTSLFVAAEQGNLQAMQQAAEKLAWEKHGRILVTK